MHVHKGAQKRDVSALDASDDEESVPVKKEQLAQTQEGSSASMEPKNRSQLGRFIILKFKNTEGRLKEWPMPEYILSRIPEYAGKLKMAKQRAGSSGRPVVEGYSYQRDPKHMMSIFDYLADGYLQPLTDESGSQCSSLRHLLSVCRTAKALKLTAMTDEVAIMVSKQDKLRSQAFFEIAMMCCEPNSGLDVTEGSVLGKWMSSYITTNLGMLDAEGYIDKVAATGGELTKSMVKILMGSQQTPRLRSTN